MEELGTSKKRVEDLTLRLKTECDSHDREARIAQHTEVMLLRHQHLGECAVLRAQLAQRATSPERAAGWPGDDDGQSAGETRTQGTDGTERLRRRRRRRRHRDAGAGLRSSGEEVAAAVAAGGSGGGEEGSGAGAGSQLRWAEQYLTQHAESTTLRPGDPGPEERSRSQHHKTRRQPRGRAASRSRSRSPSRDGERRRAAGRAPGPPQSPGADDPVVDARRCERLRWLQSVPVLSATPQHVLEVLVGARLGIA